MYNAVTSSNPTTLYRVYSDPARKLGPYTAQWGIVGGGNQVFLPWVDDAWVVRSGGF